MLGSSTFDETISSVATSDICAADTSINPQQRDTTRKTIVSASIRSLPIGRHKTYLTVATGLVGIVAFVAHRLTVDEQHFECGHVAHSFIQAAALDFQAPSPSTLLEAARKHMAFAKAQTGPEAVGTADSAIAAAKRAFEACAFWKSKTPTAKMHIKDVRSQLECSSILVEEFFDTDIDTMVVGEPILELFHQARSILQRCGDIAGELQGLRRSAKAVSSPGAALSLLSMLGSLEHPAADALEGLSWSQRLMNTTFQAQVALDGVEEDLGEVDSVFDGMEDHPSVQQLAEVRIGLRHCLLRSMREARAVSAELVASSPQVRRGTRCRPHMLEGIEGLALREASAEVDLGVKFSLGMHHSELALATREAGTSVTPTVALFGEPELFKELENSAELKVSSLVARAENLLLLSEQASSGARVSERRFMRAKRIVQHAHGVFVPLGLHDLADSRFKEASNIFMSLGETTLAAQALSDMAEHHFSIGAHVESLASAREALALDHAEPVALYLQATLRRSLGELRTEEDVHLARQQLEQVAGRLPGEELESRRAVAHAEIVGWALVAEAGTLSKCLELHDAAFVLICALCRLAYA